MDNNDNKQKSTSFESLDILIQKWRDGTFSEILDDWKWIFSYSKRYKGAIVFYTVLGILSTTLGLVSSVVGKYMIDNYHWLQDIKTTNSDMYHDRALQYLV